MLKTVLAACVFCAASLSARAEPITYVTSFTASGTLTDSDGTTHPFDGRVIFSFKGDTTDVHKVFEDGEFQGYETWTPVTIFIDGLGAMKSLVEVEAYSVRDSLELDGYVDGVLLPTFVFSYSGFYNLETSFESQGSWNINYFNMGSIPTSKGKLRFSNATSAGGYAAAPEASASHE
jgi:hypothetical protein